MRALPTGTVTLLFTDIEGSTRLLQELGRDEYVRALTDHRRLLRDAFMRHGGVEVEMQGDSFFYAFPDATGAVAAAEDAQRSLADHDWPMTPISVRIGIHTGQPTVVDQLYAGLDVHEAARVMSAGHGGQVLVSGTTYALLPSDRQTELVDLGEHRLRDIAAPVRLYQIGRRIHPPLKTLHRATLPNPTTPLVGRVGELSDLAEILLHPEKRLVTLTGVGGTGKTRLALRAASDGASQFRDGVFWVDLSSIRDARLVASAIAQTVGAREDVPGWIADRAILLALDNFEHVLEAAPNLVALLHACPNLKLLVTSREPLRVQGEWEYAVAPLDETSAVQLFDERVRAIGGGGGTPTDVAKAICRRLDCLPLAVELAAARTKVLSPVSLLDRLTHRLPVLTAGARDAPARQRTLRATLEWSFDLLAPREQRLFAALAVFGGGWTLDAAERVCDADLDTLASLVDKSLVRHTSGRFSMLETVREFALELFAASPDYERLARAHAEYFLAVAERAEPELRGPQQQQWLDTLEADHDNFRVSLAWAQARRDADVALRLCASLWRFWCTRNHAAEGGRIVEAALGLADAASPLLRVRALRAGSRLAREGGDFVRSHDLASRAAELASDTGSEDEVAAAEENLGVTQILLGDADAGCRRLEQSVRLYRELGDDVGSGNALNNRAHGLITLQRYEEARLAVDEALALQRRAGNAWGIGFALHTLGLVELASGNDSAAEARFRECVVVAEELGDAALIGDSFAGLSQVAGARGEHRDAVSLWAAAKAILEEAGQIDAGSTPTDEHWLVDARRLLDAAEYADAWNEGTTRAVAGDYAGVVAMTESRNARARDVSSR